MRNVVVQVQGKYAVLMNDMGDFVKIKNKDYKVGQRVEAGCVKKTAGVMRLLTAAAAVVVMLFGGGAYAYYTPYSYITVDINPSIELEVNIFNRIIDAKAMNDDAKPILDDIQLSGCDINTAAERIVGELMKKGYLTQESTAELMVTTSSNNEHFAEDILKKTIKALNEETKQNDINANVHGKSVSKEVKKQADEYGVTPGKLVLSDLYAQSSETPENVDIKEWTGKSVKDIMSVIKENKEENKEQNTSNKSKNNTSNTNKEEKSNDNKKEKDNAITNGNNDVGQANGSGNIAAVNNGNNSDKENKSTNTDNSGSNSNDSGNSNSNGNGVANNEKEKKDKD